MSEDTSRRDLFKTIALGGLAAGIGLAASSALAQNRGRSTGDAPTGPLSHATMTFGAWKPNGLDLFTTPPTPADNRHTLAPNEVTIKAGGSVSFIISGFHNVQIYDDGTLPQNVNTNLLTGPPAPIFIDDPHNRIYRGPNPIDLPGDRVESVAFPDPGRFLILCGLIFHYRDEMWGYVRVLP